MTEMTEEEVLREAEKEGFTKSYCEKVLDEFTNESSLGKEWWKLESIIFPDKGTIDDPKKYIDVGTKGYISIALYGRWVGPNYYQLKLEYKSDSKSGSYSWYWRYRG